MSDVKFKFTADTNAAQAAVRQFTQGVTAGFQSMLAPIAAAISVAVIKQWVSAQIDAADAASKTAQKVGMSTEALTANQYAAKLADVSNEEFTIGMKTLAQVVVDAARGQEQAVAAMQRLQINVRNSAGELRTLEELLPELADAFQAMPDGITKSDTAVQLFGRSGLNLIPMLNGGAAGLKQLREEAEKAGVTISTSTGQAAEQFNDTLTRVKAQVDGVALSLAQELLPYLQRASDGLLDFTTNAAKKKEVVSGVVDVLKGLTIVVGTATSFIKVLGAQIGLNLNAAWEQLVENVTTVLKVFKLLYDSAGNILSRLIQLGLSVGTLGKALKALASGDLVEAADAAAEFKAQVADSVVGLGQDIADGFRAQLANVEGWLSRSATRVKTWWQLTKENVLGGWDSVSGLWSMLYGPGTSRPPSSAPGGKSMPVAVSNEKAAAAVRDMLAKINEEYRQAFTEKTQLLEENAAEELRRLGEQLMRSKNLRAEDLQNDEDYAIAKLQLDRMVAQQRERLARETEEKIFGNAAARLQNQQAGVEGNSFLSAGQKSDQLMPILQQRLSLLQAMRGTYAAMAADASLTDEARLEAESKQLAVMGQMIGIKQQMQDMDRTAAAELQRQVATLRTESEGVTRYIATGFDAVRSAASAFGGTVADLIDGTANWGQTFARVSKQIVSQLATITAQFIAGKMAEMAVNTMVSRASQAESDKEAVKGAVAGLGKASEQGGWVGALIYLGVYAASLAAIMGLAAAATSGFAEGGLVTGPGSEKSDSIMARLSNGEFVMNAAATRRNLPLLEMLNSGMDGIAAARQRSLASPNAALAGMGAASPEVNVAAAPVSVVVLKDAGELKQFLESNAGRRIVVQHVRNSRTDLGLET